MGQFMSSHRSLAGACSCLLTIKEWKINQVFHFGQLEDVFQRKKFCIQEHHPARSNAFCSGQDYLQRLKFPSNLRRERVSEQQKILVVWPC